MSGGGVEEASSTCREENCSGVSSEERTIVERVFQVAGRLRQDLVLCVNMLLVFAVT